MNVVMIGFGDVGFLPDYECRIIEINIETLI